MSYALDGFADDVRRWCDAAGSRAPAYQKLLGELLALLGGSGSEAVAVRERLQGAWAARTFRVFYDRPLLVVAALRRDALVEGTGHPLWSALAREEPIAGDITPGALFDALARDSFWESIRTRFVQTNETSRAIAWLWPAALVGERPLALFEVGAAAGLNLVADRLPRPWTTALGAPLPGALAPRITARIGLDAHPLDVRDDDDANWLRACVWAGERARLGRLEAALAELRSSPVELRRGDVTEASEMLRDLSSRSPAGAVVLAFQTIVRDYLDEQTRAAHERGMRRWLEDARPSSAVWVELEIVHGDRVHVPIVAHTREASGVTDVVLGATSYHPESVEIDARAVERFGAVFRPATG